MNKEKQIEEMEIALREAQHELDKAWHECLHNKGTQPRREFLFTAQYLIENKGYRKASDVAREIFVEIENSGSLIIAGLKHYIICERELAELKKKWEVEE